MKPIKKEPLFNVGDIVRVVKRTGKESDYKYSYTDTMSGCEGQIFRVLRVYPDHNEDTCKISDDNAMYKIGSVGDLQENEFSWASSMLELVKDQASIWPEKAKFKCGQHIHIKAAMSSDIPLITIRMEFADNDDYITDCFPEPNYKYVYTLKGTGPLIWPECTLEEI